MANMIIAHSYAKINLALKILGKRPDGYHDIWSIFQTISLHDTITFKSRKDDKLILHCQDPAVPLDDSNLILKAAKLLQNYIRERKWATSAPMGAKIFLEKKIPLGAGLGGGSSNAAVTLMSLPKLWFNNKLPDRTILFKLAEEIGSDVPFFLTGGTCLVTGRGEEVQRMPPLGKLFLVVIYPEVNINTGWAYSQLSLSLTKRSKCSKIKVQGLRLWKQREDVKKIMCNDFEPLVLSRFPEVARAHKELECRGALKALLSGSGSSVFGIFPDAITARRAWQGLRPIWPRSFLVTTNIKAYKIFKTTR